MAEAASRCTTIRATSPRFIAVEMLRGHGPEVLLYNPSRSGQNLLRALNFR